MTEKLKGEGEITIVQKVRRTCEECGEPAVKRATFLLLNARTNPKSSGYRKDDISWCSDDEIFYCLDCYTTTPPDDDYSWCSTFEVSDRFAHMFLKKETVDNPVFCESIARTLRRDAGMPD